MSFIPVSRRAWFAPAPKFKVTFSIRIRRKGCSPETAVTDVFSRWGVVAMVLCKNDAWRILANNKCKFFFCSNCFVARKYRNKTFVTVNRKRAYGANTSNMTSPGEEYGRCFAQRQHMVCFSLLIEKKTISRHTGTRARHR